MTTYKIKKEFTPMDFYDYVKSQGREKCEEFKKDFEHLLKNVDNPYFVYRRLDGMFLNSMLSERANFRRYMIEGGFVEEDKPKEEFNYWIEDTTHFKRLLVKNKITQEDRVVAHIYKDGSGMALLSSTKGCGHQTDSEGRIKIL